MDQEDRPPTLRELREIAQDSSDIVWLNAPRAKARGRRITLTQVIVAIRMGTIDEGPFRNERLDWQWTLRRHAAGEEIKVVVIYKDGKLLVRSNH